MSEYIGRSDKVAQFTKEFLRRRDALQNKKSDTKVKSGNSKKKGKSKKSENKQSDNKDKLKGKKQSSAQMGYFGVLDDT